MAALGQLAPGGSDAEYLRMSIGVLVQRVRNDRERFLTGEQRQALVAAISKTIWIDRDEKQWIATAAQCGHWGCANATDASLIEAVASLSLDDLVSVRTCYEYPPHGGVVAHIDEDHKANVIAALTHPRSQQILEGFEDPQERLLLASLNDAIAQEADRPRG
ncbi:hypothetical protein A8M77_01875 [Variovorax sp. JS1663]|nr:hypothetical protein A8M77_01875 [Variovorax sp. JS1663]